jgi:hypothetical protein
LADRKRENRPAGWIDPKQADFLQEIRDTYQYYMDAWRDIRDEAQIDMRFVSGDPWDPKDRKFREDNDRPCMTWDELSPYINQLINDPRQNKRAIKVNPIGAGANDQTAELRADIIRSIEYNSKAQSAYTTGFQGAAERSYGYWGVGKRYVTSVGKKADPTAFNQELYIRRIPNPDSVIFDPNYKEVDCSDAMGCFVVDIVRKEDFKRKWPNAQIISFDPEHHELAPMWIREKEVMVAEFWKVTIEQKKLYMVGDDEPVALYEDELPTGFEISKAKKQRTIERRVVTQYITNGVEILDQEKIEIPWIPIVPVFGKEIWLDEGSGSKRKLISLVRMARDPFMAYCYYRSQEAEEAGMTPKVPYLALEGQISGREDEWESANKIPRAVLQYKAVDTGGQPYLNPPTRQPFQPNFQAYEVACEAARRAVMTAMSGSNLPTAAQRQNQKSGVALEKIDEQEDRGTFHFIDNYNFALEQTGRILDAWIPYVYDTKREMGIRKADETHQVVTINDPDHIGEDGQPEVYDTQSGEHSVTISTGPSFESQRMEASDFVDTLMQSIEALAQLMPPGAAAKVIALGVKLKQLGPIGDEISETISPPQDQQAMQQQLQQGQAQMQQQAEVISKMQQELQKLQLEKAGKVIQGETQKALQQMKNDIDVLKALLASKQSVSDQEFEMFKTFWQENHGAAHDVAMQKMQHDHEKSQAMQAAQTQSAQSAQDASQAITQQTLAAQQQPEESNA